MLLLFLGLADIFFTIMMLLAHFGVYSSWRIALAALVFWLAKGIMFRGSFLSVLDILAGIYFILVMLGAHTPVVYLFAGIMAYKMTMSLMLRG